MPRIDRVRLENYYHRYPSQTSPAKNNREESLPPFLEPDEKGVIYEPSSVKRKEPAVIDETREEKQEEAKAPGTENAERTIPELLKELGLRILTFIRRVISNIWNGPASEEGAEATGEKAEQTEEFAATLLEETRSEAEPRRDTLEQIIAEHDMEQLVRYVTENGEKKPAHSTDLLTIYNRYGRVNRIDPSDRKKILEGNFHDIQL